MDKYRWLEDETATKWGYTIPCEGEQHATDTTFKLIETIDFGEPPGKWFLKYISHDLFTYQHTKSIISVDWQGSLADNHEDDGQSLVYVSSCSGMIHATTQIRIYPSTNQYKLMLKGPSFTAITDIKILELMWDE